MPQGLFHTTNISINAMHFQHLIHCLGLLELASLPILPQKVIVNVFVMP
jgi:hypothetical protein